MTDPSTPVPSDEAVSDAWCELHDGLPSGCSQVLARKALTAAYAIDAPRIAAEAAAEARAATLREVREAERELAIQRDYYWQALTDIAGYEGWQAADVPAAKAMGDIARAALAHFDPEGNR